MLKGRVVASVWATRRLPEIPHGAFLEVETEDGSRLVALDTLGSGIGECVLVVTGSIAAIQFQPATPPIDALIIGSVDEVPGGGAEPKRREE
ncbi:MAG: EutN/CcmL family microcompartment protein [Acidimicrobiia bacterium]